MRIKVGTFNLNNLFSRYNFKASISAIKKGTTVEYTFGKDDLFKIKNFRGQLIKPKKEVETFEIAQRIKALDIDILAVQEVENIDILKKFNKDFLNGAGYKYNILIEGNDPRFIDVGLLSRYPIGAITSWQEKRFGNASNKIFSRDLLQVEILNPSGTRKLFTLFNTHLKSHFVDNQSTDPEGDARKSNEKRRKQSAAIAEIIKDQTRPNSSFILLGDMNDDIEAAPLAEFINDPELNLFNALQNMVEIGEMNRTKYPPDDHFWTHRFNRAAGIYEYKLYDQIWISQALVDNLRGAWVGRREKVGGNGSDHDPVWIDLEL